MKIEQKKAIILYVRQIDWDCFNRAKILEVNTWGWAASGPPENRSACKPFNNEYRCDLFSECGDDAYNSISRSLNFGIKRLPGCLVHGTTVRNASTDTSRPTH
ncbi:unnamed protein product [Sphacelaria rigidula]